MCWGTVVILKPFEKHKSHILIENDPRLPYFEFLSLSFFLYWLDLFSNFF